MRGPLLAASYAASKVVARGVEGFVFFFMKFSQTRGPTCGALTLSQVLLSGNELARAEAF